MPIVSTLCDVNVLLALVTDRHALHTTAVHWFDDVPPGGATICRVVQLGLLRLLNNPSVMREDTLDAATCWDIWHQLLEDQRLRYTPIEPNGLDAAFERFTTGKVFTPRLWTDAYLAAYALVSSLVLVTFDQGFRQFDSLECHLLAAGPPAH
jgi:uncharacterized protein